MYDLFSGLIKIKKGHKKFWGKYEELNNIEIPNSTLLFETQIERLQELENQDNLSYKEVNRFLEMAQQKLPQIPQIREEITNQLYIRIIELMNSGLRGSELNPHKTGKTYNKKQATQNINNILKELRELLTLTNTSYTLKNDMIRTLTKRLKNYKWDVDYEYIHEKASEAERFAAEQLSKIEGIEAIQGGSLYHNGAQLIEDVFAFPKEELKKERGLLSYTIKYSKTQSVSKEAKSIENFFNQIEKVKNKKCSIILSDELYEVLQTAALIKTQVKSGRNQNILNKAEERNSISLEKLKFDNLIWALYKHSPEYFKDYNKQNSKDLEAITNYYLSKNIAETNISRNEMYMSEEGFTSAAGWMKLTNKYLVFSPGLNRIKQDFYLNKNPYIFIDK